MGVTAVSIKSDGEIIADLHDFGLDTNPVLASLASKMEIDACNMSIDSADLVLMEAHFIHNSWQDKHH